MKKYTNKQFINTNKSILGGGAYSISFSNIGNTMFEVNGIPIAPGQTAKVGGRDAKVCDYGTYDIVFTNNQQQGQNTCVVTYEMISD